MAVQDYQGKVKVPPSCLAKRVWPLHSDWWILVTTDRPYGGCRDKEHRTMDVVTRSRARATTREVSASGDCPVPMGFWAFLRSPPTTPLSGSHCTTGPGPSHSSSNKSQSNLTREWERKQILIVLITPFYCWTTLGSRPHRIIWVWMNNLTTCICIRYIRHIQSVSITNFYPSSIVFIHNEASFGIMPSALRINA
jgi:hypothetical protein